MPHADTSLVPTSIQTKPEFWIHVHAQLQSLLQGQRDWISNLANASSLIFNSLLAFRMYIGNDNKPTVNWCGFYIDSALYPSPRYSDSQASNRNRLLLGPFCGKPACQFISIAPNNARGVCADAYMQRKSLIVPDVDQYPGHIACDGETKSEIVIPLIYDVTENKTVVLGVLDLDSLAINGFDEEDREGLENIAKLIVNSCNW